MEDKATCPVSGEIMRRPVVAPDGITYDQSAIESWLRTCPGRTSSPVTRAPMENRLVTAYLVRELMEADATCRLEVLPPTHGVSRVPRGRAIQSDQAQAARIDALRPRSASEWLGMTGFFITTTATGASFMGLSCVTLAAVVQHFCMM